MLLSLQEFNLQMILNYLILIHLKITLSYKIDIIITLCLSEVKRNDFILIKVILMKTNRIISEIYSEIIFY